MSQWLHTSVRWFWVTCAVLLISAAVLVQLGRSFSFLLADFREPLAERWSEQLGMAVSIDALSMDWKGLSPELIVENLELETNSGEPVLAVAEAEIEIQVLSSLLEWRLVLGHVGFRRIELSFVQESSGQWNVPGIKFSGQKSKDSVINPFQSFLIGQRVDLNDAVINLTWANGKRLSLEVPEIRLENKQDFHRLVVRLDIDGMPDVVTAIVEGQGHPADRENFRARGYLNINQLTLERPIALLMKQLTDNVPEDLNPEAAANLELWWNYDGQSWSVQGQSGLAGGWPFQLPDQISPVHSLNLNFEGTLERDGRWDLDIRDLHSAWGAQITERFTLSLSGRPSQPMRLRINEVNLDYLMALYRANTNFDGKFAEILETLNVAGRLQHIDASIPLSSPKDFSFAANIHNLSNHRWQGVPALSGIDGFLFAEASGGYLQLDSQQGMSMLYSIYDQPMQYDTAIGTVAWHLRPDQNSVFINSSELKFHGSDGIATGHFLVNLPWRKGSRPSEMVLQVGLTDSRAEFYDTYVPNTVPETVQAWLNRSVGQGDVRKAGFIYRGSLRPGDVDNRTVQLYLDIDNTDLDYHPQWPAIGNIQAQMLMDDVDIEVAVDQASLHRSALSNTQVNVLSDETTNGLKLAIQADVQGPLSDGLEILRNSPVRKAIGESLDSWQVSGDMDAHLDLEIPLSAGGGQGRQSIVAKIDRGQLFLSDLNLPFSDLSGTLKYQSEKGLSSEQFQGRLWGQNFSAHIDSQPGAQGFTQIDAKGSNQWPAVYDWSQRPELTFLRGNFDYSARLLLPNGQPPQLTLESDLKGTLIDLPGVYGKLPGEPRKMIFEMSSAEQGLEYQLELGDLAELAIQQQASSVASMQLKLIDIEQSTAPILEPTPGEFTVIGSVPDFNLTVWLDVFDRYQKALETVRFNKLLSENSEVQSRETQTREMSQTDGEFSKDSMDQPTTSSTLNTRLNIDFARFALGEFEFQDMNIAGLSKFDQWQFQLEHPEVAGEVKFSPNQPLKLNLEYLHFEVAESETDPKLDAQVAFEPEPLSTESASESSAANTSPVDPLAGFDPSDLVAMDVFIDSLKWGSDDWGRWSLSARPIDAGIELSQLKAQAKQLELSAVSDLDYSERPGTVLRWRWDEFGHPYTEIVGQLKGNDIAKTLMAFGQEPLMESQSSLFQFDWHWQGSPLALNLYNLEGRLEVDFSKGRFLNETAGGADVMKLIGILNFDTWMRRLQLDFGDLYKSGLVFNSLQGDLRFDQGMLYLDEPLNLRSPSSSIQLSGAIDLENEQLDTELVATLPVVGNLTLITALTAGLPAAAGVYLVSKLFEKQIDKASSLTYSMKGSWSEPELTFEKMFDRTEPKNAGVDTQTGDALPASP